HDAGRRGADRTAGRAGGHAHGHHHVRRDSERSQSTAREALTTIIEEQIMKTLFTRLLAALLLAGFATGAMAEIVVGGKNFTEQLLLSSMTGQYLSAHGFDTDIRSGMGSTVLRKAQLNGQVDVYWEYVGTSLIVYNDVEKELSPEESYQTVKKMDAEKGLVWLDPSDANNTY